MADPESTTWSITVELPYDGGDPDGLGLGTTLACFRDAFGEPDAAEFEYLDGGYLWTWGYWDYAPDGYVDRMYLYGGMAL